MPWFPNRCVSSNRLNSPRLSHRRILEGNEFDHRRGGPAVVKHRSLKMLCDRRTAHIAVSVERSRRMLMSSAMSWQSSDIRRCIAGQKLEDQDSDLELDSLSHGQPVQLPQNRCDVITAPRTSYKSRGGVLDGLYCTVRDARRHASRSGMNY